MTHDDANARAKAHRENALRYLPEDELSDASSIADAIAAVAEALLSIEARLEALEHVV